jgi:pimeloyl-ACP methyl ester carboxylesterase
LQFVAPVVVELESAPEEADAVPDEDLQQSVRFARAPDGLQLAVATVGRGAPLVKAANWLTHVELDWRSPVWRHWNDALAARFEYIRYDARGCGLSDRDLSGSDLTDLDVWVDDLTAVVDASGLDRFALLGISQGAAPAMDFAVRHPERVSHLILYGAYVRGMHRRDEATRQRAEMFRTLMREGWGGANPAFRSVFTTTFMPDASSEQMRWFNDLQVQTADAANAIQLEAAFYDHDFTELAEAVTVPTLVFHSRGDLATPYEEGRALAALIPGAELVTLDSRNHILVESEPAWQDFLHHLDRFTSESA